MIHSSAGIKPGNEFMTAMKISWVLLDKVSNNVTHVVSFKYLCCDVDKLGFS